MCTVYFGQKSRTRKKREKRESPLKVPSLSMSYVGSRPKDFLDKNGRFFAPAAQIFFIAERFAKKMFLAQDLAV